MIHRAGWLLGAAVLFAAQLMSAVAAEEAGITVMNPRGIKPAIRLIPMAQRPGTLEGRTIYIVDTKYPNTRQFSAELYRNLAEKYPATNWILKDKKGSYFDDDPELWAEIKQQAQGAIVLIGH